MRPEKWVEYGWLRRSRPAQVRSRIWELWIVALRIQRSKLFRPTFSIYCRFQRGAQRRNDSAPRVGSSHRHAGRSSRQNNRVPRTHHKSQPEGHSKIQTFNSKRNKSVYDVAGAVSDQELEAMVKLAEELNNNTLAWLRKLHPELAASTGPSGPTRAGGD